MVCSQWYYPDRPSVRPRLDTCSRAFGCGIEPMVLVALASFQLLRRRVVQQRCGGLGRQNGDGSHSLCVGHAWARKISRAAVQVEWNEPREQSVQRRDVIAACAGERRGLPLYFCVWLYMCGLCARAHGV